MGKGKEHMGNTTRARAIDGHVTILAMVLVTTVTEAMLLLLPIYIGAIVDFLPLDASQVGLLGSADLVGVALGATSGLFWLRKVDWRKTVLAALLVFSIANLCSLGVTAFMPLGSLRLLAGLAAGAAYAVALAGLCDTSHQARNTALMVCGQVIFGAVGIYLLPLVPDALRLDGVYYYMLAWTAITLAVVWIAFPDNPASETVSEPVSLSGYGLPGLLAFGGTGFYFLTIGAVWGYLERIALEAGMTLAEVGATLSLGYIISLAGSFGAAWMGTRYGRAWHMIVIGAVQLFMLFLFTRLDHYDDALGAFLVINAIFQFFWSFIIAYQVVIFNDADHDGRFIPLYGTAMHIALAIGPFAGAFMIDGDSYRPILWFGMVTLSACYLMFLGSIWRRKRAVEGSL